MKKINFRLVPTETISQKVDMNIGTNADSHGLQATCKRKSFPKSKEATREATPRTTSVKCLSMDYDGTISPLDISRSESRVPLETRVMLQQIGKLLPISIITMKDLPFVVPRTPFAHGWSAIGGLETKIGKRVLKVGQLESILPSVSRALDYAKSHISVQGIEVEEKQDLEGKTIAFCVDWRQARDLRQAKRELERIADYCRTLRLRVLTYKNQPYLDVYPVIPDKGKGLQEILGELSVKEGVMYLGDSEVDNPAFRVSSVSVGVIQGEKPPKTLDCEYFVKFGHVSDFLKTLIERNFQFSSDFPMVMRNINRLNDQSLDDERGPRKSAHDGNE
jgi:trehalose-6-phosphatase